MLTTTIKSRHICSAAASHFFFFVIESDGQGAVSASMVVNAGPSDLAELPLTGMYTHAHAGSARSARVDSEAVHSRWRHPQTMRCVIAALCALEHLVAFVPLELPNAVYRP